MIVFKTITFIAAFIIQIIQTTRTAGLNMIKIYSTEARAYLKEENRSEAELNRFLSDNWNDFFPKYQFIKREFALDGNVRSKGGSGRIDILAFNPDTKKFIVIELKKDFSKNIRDQASDYRDFIEDNLHKIYLQATQKYGISLPVYHNIIEYSIEVIMIAKSFSQTDIDKAVKSGKEITLVKYVWLENQLFVIEYLNNIPIEDARTNPSIASVYVAKSIAVDSSLQVQKENPVAPPAAKQRNSTKELQEGVTYRIEDIKIGVEAFGYKLADGKRFMILAGSKIRSVITKSTHSHVIRERDKLIQNGSIKDFVFIKDTIISAPSTAASIVLGRSENFKLWTPS